jgi:hypothetical protein
MLAWKREAPIYFKPTALENLEDSMIELTIRH